MTQDFMRFEELIKTDKTIQEKLKTAIANYQGSKTAEDIFEAVVLPIAKEADFNISFEEYKAYTEGVNDTIAEGNELSAEELQAVTGGSKDGWDTFVDIISGGMVE